MENGVIFLFFFFFRKGGGRVHRQFLGLQLEWNLELKKGGGGWQNKEEYISVPAITPDYVHTQSWKRDDSAEGGWGEAKSTAINLYLAATDQGWREESALFPERDLSSSLSLQSGLEPD